MRWVFVPLGMLFGFLLSRAGATTYDYYAKLFLFEDFQLLWVILTAAAVGMVGIALVARLRTRALLGGGIDLRKKPYTRSLIVGSLIFGIGWGLAGACPGTALAMLGEGKLGAAFSIAGLLCGTYLFGRRAGAQPTDISRVDR
ncbi:MAG: YeeE/YedE family protein [Deltaproteobacteria bacterium]|nr:YeeE/YedE family protein [Deltaproteobacteria bacterium]